MSAAASSIPTQAMKIEKVKEHIGAIVTGIDLAHPVDGATQYQKGDLLIIDDRASLHKAGFDYDHSQHRRLYRMLVRGDRPC